MRRQDRETAPCIARAEGPRDLFGRLSIAGPAKPPKAGLSFSFFLRTHLARTNPNDDMEGMNLE